VGHIWRLDLKDERHALAPPVRLLSGRGIVWRPSYSPDGKKIAFESDRMGYEDIWMCDSDGSNCSQLTALHGTSGTARWSPNGRYMSFESASRRTITKLASSKYQMALPVCLRLSRRQ
jgi:Tol biopolymer transport system component